MSQCKRRTRALPPPPAGERVGGQLSLGFNTAGDVVLDLGQSHTGHIVFSPHQARTMANLLLRKADEAEALRKGHR